MRSWMVFAFVLTSGLVGRQAFAQKPATLEKEARKACLSGDYAKGVSILAELFVNTEDATYLYNQGRCYEQNVRYTEAAERFREFLRKAKKIGPSIKADAEKHIAECEAAAARTQTPTIVQPAAAPNAPPTPPPAIPPAAPVPTMPPYGPAVGSPEITRTPETTHPWQHTAKWIASGAAVAFLGLGVGEHINYYSKNHDYNNKPECTNNKNACKGLADSADTAQTVAIVGYSAAAVAAGLAVMFWLTDSPKHPSGDHAGVHFECAPAPAGIGCRGQF